MNPNHNKRQIVKGRSITDEFRDAHSDLHKKVVSAKQTILLDQPLQPFDPEHFSVLPGWMAELNKISEGQSATLGAYNRPWK